MAKLELKVGALTTHAVAPHYYGFTWSPVGVATEYMKEALVLRNFKKTRLPALSDRAIIIIDGVSYEDDLTSGVQPTFRMHWQQRCAPWITKPCGFRGITPG